jgi:predicted HicB family RNase H-like nuclease
VTFFQESAFSLKIILDSIVVIIIIKINSQGGEKKMAQYLIRDFPKDLHKRAKIRAAEEEITLQDLIIKAVEAYLKAGKGGK